MTKTGAWCPQCGPYVACDEDGCCASCGADAAGEGAEKALACLAIVRYVAALPWDTTEECCVGGALDGPGGFSKHPCSPMRVSVAVGGAARAFVDALAKQIDATKDDHGT